MIDKRALSEDLTGEFIKYQYRLDNPMPSPTETEATTVLKYRNDPIFHAKVNQLVSGVMYILSRHI